MPIYGKEVTRLTSGGLTDVWIVTYFRNTANNRREKSAEAIVDKSNELIKKRDNQKTHNLLKGRILISESKRMLPNER